MNDPIAPASALRRRLGPLATLLAFFALALAWLSLSRLALAAWQWPNLSGVDGVSRLFLVGLRMDTVLLCYLLAVPVLARLLLPGERLARAATALLLAAAGFLLVLMELATPAFLAEYDQRPNCLFFEYLLYPREVFGMLWASHRAALLGGGALTAAIGWMLWRRLRTALDGERTWGWPRRLLVLPLVLALVFIGARSSFGHRAANISTASFSGSRLANELALNSSFSMLYAAYSQSQEVDPTRLYGRMDWAEIVARVRKYSGVPQEAYTQGEIPTLHRQDVAARSRPLNLVIVLQESLGAGFVGSLGGLPLTPNLDRLAREGLYFTRLYATGTRTARGIEAVLAGFLPTPAPAVLKLPEAQGGFFTLASLLQRHGYATDYIYGGVANFDNMRAFCLGNGFDRVIEEEHFSSPRFRGTWGVSDEDWVEKANEVFRAHGDRPFFALMLSTSNHDPFEFPDGRIELYEQPANTRHNAIKYADYALGRLFELAQKEAYYADTVFLIVGDHDARVFGADFVPAQRFRIPGLILGPGVPVRREARLASQVDLGPTLLRLIGLRAEHPMVGRDLLALPAQDPGRAVMQYDLNHGFRVGDRMVVHCPSRPAQTFAVDESDRLHPVAADPELTRDGLAHALWASESYRRRLYRLAETPASGQGTAGVR